MMTTCPSKVGIPNWVGKVGTLLLTHHCFIEWGSGFVQGGYLVNLSILFLNNMFG